MISLSRLLCRAMMKMLGLHALEFQWRLYPHSPSPEILPMEWFFHLENLLSNVAYTCWPSGNVYAGLAWSSVVK